MPDGNFLSHTSRPLEIAKILRKTGYDIVFAGDGKYMELPRKNGFQTFPIVTLDPGPSLVVSRKGRVNHYSYELMEECVREEMKLFERVKPDVILADWRHSISTSCELAGIPLVAIMNASWTNYYTISLIAPEHFIMTQFFGKRVTTWFMPLIKKVVITFDIRPINKYRRHRGLKPLRNFWDVLKGDLNLLVDIPEYGPTKDLPSNFHPIGPIFWEPDVPPPEWLKKLDAERPTLYFTMGTTGYPRFFNQALEIYGNTDFQCIITTAGLAKLNNVPDNFFVVDYAPGSKIMEKSDIVVCHGGNGTIYQAMSNGVPIIGIPTMHDQEFNLDRVEDLGIGIHLSELKFKPKHLVEAVDKIMTEKSFREHANRYKKILAKYNGPATGAQLIDAYLKDQ